MALFFHSGLSSPLTITTLLTQVSVDVRQGSSREGPLFDIDLKFDHLFFIESKH